jgi:Fibronectin type III domain.
MLEHPNFPSLSPLQTYLTFDPPGHFSPSSVPGPPTDVKLTNVNSTTVHVEWRPPNEKERNGVIRGYHIHVQETKEEVRILNLMETKASHSMPGRLDRYT